MSERDFITIPSAKVGNHFSLSKSEPFCFRPSALTGLYRVKGREEGTFENKLALEFVGAHYAEMDIGVGILPEYLYPMATGLNLPKTTLADDGSQLIHLTTSQGYTKILINEPDKVKANHNPWKELKYLTISYKQIVALDFGEHEISLRFHMVDGSVIIIGAQKHAKTSEELQRSSHEFLINMSLGKIFEPGVGKMITL